MKLGIHVRRWGKAAVALVFAALARPAAAVEMRRPNVLMIAIDDLNDWVGCLGGHPQARTPHIDALAARGVLFANAHCQAPLCNPSRTSVLTGLRPSSTGVYGLMPGFRDVDALKARVTLPQAFRQAGYFTATFGKIYHDGSLSPARRPAEVEVWGPAPGMPLPPKKFVETPDPIRAMDWGVFPDDDRDQADWKIADAAIAQLHATPKDRPFFIAAGFRLPHVPCFASQKWFDLFPEADVKLPQVKDDDRGDIPDFAWKLHWSLPEPRLKWLREAGQWAPLVRSYLASTAFMDSQVGRLLDALQADPRANDTIVVLWSDHGWHLGEKGITGKNTLWEESTRVPLILAGPGVSKGICRQPVELLDLFPTLAVACAIKAPEGLEGHSLVPQLGDPAAPRPWPAITTANQGNHAIRTDRWRYIRYADGSEELYDRSEDPNEWKNLAADAAMAAVKADLARHLPARDVPPVPKSAQRILERKGDVWFWEGRPIPPDATPE